MKFRLLFLFWLIYGVIHAQVPDTRRSYVCYLQTGEIKLDGLLNVGFETSRTRFKISSPSKVGNGTWYITEDSRLWKQ